MNPEDVTAAAVASLTTNPPAAQPADNATTSGTVENTPDVTVDSSTTQDPPADTAAQAQDGEEGQPAAPQQPNKPSKGVQKRIDELVRDREHERREKQQLLDLLARNGINPAAPAPVQQQRPTATTDEPRPEQFQTYEQYLDARTEWRWNTKEAEARKRDADAASRRADQELGRKLAKAESTAAGRYEDFDEVVATVKADDFPATKAMAEFIAESEHGGDLLYWLGSHRDEAERISRLSPVQQARELSRVERDYTSPQAPASRNRPSAPPPPATLRGGGAPTSNLGTMSFADLRKTVAGWQRR